MRLDKRVQDLVSHCNVKDNAGRLQALAYIGSIANDVLNPDAGGTCGLYLARYSCHNNW